MIGTDFDLLWASSLYSGSTILVITLIILRYLEGKIISRVKKHSGSFSFQILEIKIDEIGLFADFIYFYFPRATISNIDIYYIQKNTLSLRFICDRNEL